MIPACRNVLVALAVLLPGAANALLFRAYLAADGNDANPCTLSQPCRLLPAALTKVVSAGEIWLLDSANYNTATVAIAQSVTILAVPGAVGSVIATAGPAITISGSSKVALRNLVIVPLPGTGGTDGVQVAAGSTVQTEGCVFANLTGKGVLINGIGTARIANTTFRNTNGGVWLQNGATGVISGSLFTDVSNGSVIVYSPGADATDAYVSDSTFSGGLIGLQTNATVAGGGSASASITRSSFLGLDYGINATNTNGAPSTISISNSVIAGSHAYGYDQINTATIISLGNNQFFNNEGNFGSPPTVVTPN